MMMRSSVTKAGLVCVVVLGALLAWGNHDPVWRSRVQHFTAVWLTNDQAHTAQVIEAAAHSAFRHRRLWRRRDARFCAEEFPNGTDGYAFAVAVGNVPYLAPTVALSYTLSKYSCVSTWIAFVPPNAPAMVAAALQDSGWQVIVRDDLSCESRGRPVHNSEELTARMHSNFMRVHAWTLPYKRVIYLDSDFLLLDSIDELFRMPLAPNEVGAAHVAQPRASASGFNSGLLVISPSLATYRAIIAKWGSYLPRCYDDQKLLWIFFTTTPGARLRFLPYSYNVKTAVFYPMSAFHGGRQQQDVAARDAARPRSRPAVG